MSANEPLFTSAELAMLADILRDWTANLARSREETMDGLELLTKVNRLRERHAE